MQQEYQPVLSEYIDPTPPRNPRKNNVRDRPLPIGCEVDQPEDLPENSSKIPLTRGLFAIVDTDMVEDLMRFSWSAAPDNRTCYAVTRDVNGNNVRMHKHVLRANNHEKVIIDHRNGNGLDNRRCNIHFVTPPENQGPNRKKVIKRKKRFKGVCHSSSGGFYAMLKVDGKSYKKLFSKEVDAAMYYDQLVLQHKGPAAKTNLSKGKYTPEELAAYSPVGLNSTEKSLDVETRMKLTELKSDIGSLYQRAEYHELEATKARDKAKAYERALECLTNP